MNTSCDIRLRFAFAREFNALLDDREGDAPVLWVSPDTTIDTLLECQRVLAGAVPNIHRLASDELQAKINDFYQATSADASEVIEQIEGEHVDSLDSVMIEIQDLLVQSESSAPAIRLINTILIDAIRRRASDVHLETYGDDFVIRYRIDGILQDISSPSKHLSQSLISRIKIMASMDIAEKRVPQDGSISTEFAGKKIDVRVATLSTKHGERVVMRLLQKEESRVQIGSIGLDSHQKQTFQSLLNSPQGLVLVTGPTGSGKSTTLYAGMKELDIKGKNVLTVEDPIEYELAGIGQTQVNTKAGITFASTLKAMLRQDPDIVMVGEIRDEETAKTAIQAGLTGHLVLSTLHTNTALGAIPRLIDMGVESYLLAGTLRGVIGQRLVRQLCEHCKAPEPADESTVALFERHQLGISDVYRATGCSACNDTGYSGRIGVYQVIEIGQAQRELIRKSAQESDLRQSLGVAGQSLLYHGLLKVKAGATTVEEALRVL